MIPTEYFKKIKGTNGVWEIRIKIGTNIYRVFSFFDHDKLIILANGFKKKTQKTLRNEIKKAESIKRAYFYEK